MSGKEVETHSGEVHFKRRHLPDHPSGGNLEWPPNNDDRYENRQINVDRFCHDTHEREYRQIRPQENGDCTTIPRMKTGKETYGQLKGGTYTPKGDDTPAIITGDTRYRVIETTEPVLPGFYIWWSIHVDNPDNNDDLPPYIHNLSIPFIDPPESRYGSKRISITSLHLLQSYQHGFVNEGGHYPHLQFRNGGTLRYKLEICYVVIVSAEGHFTGADGDYPVIEYATNPVIPANVQYDDNGRITAVGQWSVIIRNGKLTAGRIGKKRMPFKKFSWDHYAFAFHFPRDVQRMVIPSDHNPGSPHHVRVDDVVHIKKEPIGNRWGCPDQQYLLGKK